MSILLKFGLVFCLFCTVPTVLGSAQKSFKFYKDVTKLAQSWTGAVQTFTDSFASYNRSLDLETYENVTGFEDPLLAEALNQSLTTLQQAKDAISDLRSVIVNYSNAFRSILFDEQKDIEARFGVLLEELSAQTGSIGETCTTLHKDKITNAAAQFTENIKSCADSVVSSSPEALVVLENFVSLAVVAADMTVEPMPSANQCKLDILKAVRTKYTELKTLVDECLQKD